MFFEEINKKYKIFIFDNDGVILDSNQAKTDAFIKCIEGNDKSKIEFATPLHELIINNDTLRTYRIGDSQEKKKMVEARKAAELSYCW